MEEEQVDEVLVQLIPQEVREINFYGDTLLIALIDGVFMELYRRFGVASYTQIRQADYQNVLTFLNDWRKSAQADE
ncbi:MAG: ORF6C domain-containing protein [Ktedonobacteraceae bacterium]|nr:ORF6C domain-containing protein [Ktedonobacteraceae bacterium]